MTDQPLPQGMVTFLWTDMVDSMRTAGILGDFVYQSNLLYPHRNTLEIFFQQHQGVVAQAPGDGFLVAFQRADDALACAIAIQEHFAKAPVTHTQGDAIHTVQVRVGIHTSRIQVQATKSPAGGLDYGTYDVSFAFRVMSLASGGQLLVSDTTHTLADGHKGDDWKEWAYRRIKSVTQPEMVWELKYDGVERGEPGVRWVPEWYRGELNRYIARPKLQEKVFYEFRDRAFDGSASRLVTLKAEGGMGKTRLAIACAMQMAGAFQDGVYFVNLAGRVRSREAVSEAVGAEMGLSGEAALPANLLKALSDKEALLILDNYEAIECPEAVRFIADLIRQTSSLRLLVTGREAVKLNDVEQLVPGMDDGMEPEEAREFFLAYARHRHKKGQEWNPTDAENAEILRILKLTDNIPLAVELAAAWVERRSLKQIATGLAATLLGPETGTPPRSYRLDPSPHHDSLTRSLEWSYSLLEEWAQVGFAPLSLFADSFVPAAVAVLTEQEAMDAQDLLDRLADASLVRRSEINEESRYRLHRFTSEFAKIKLKAMPAANAIRKRFVDYYIQFVAANGDLNSVECLNVLSYEWRNVLSAFQIAEFLKDAQAVLALSDLGNYLDRRGLWAEQESLYQRALAVARNAGDRHGEGQTLGNLGIVYKSQGKWKEAEDIYNRSLGIRRELGDRHGEGNTLGNLALLMEAQEKIAEALTFARQAVAVLETTEDTALTNRILEWIAEWEQFGSSEK